MRPLIFLHLAALFCAVQGRRLSENKLNHDDDQRLWWRSEDSLFTDESSNSGKDRADDTERAAVEFSIASRNSKTTPNLIKKRDNTEDDIFQAPVSKAKRSQIKSKLPLDSIKKLKKLQDKVLILAPTRTKRRRRSTESLAESSENINVHGNATSPSMEPDRRPRQQRRRRITISIDAKGLPPGYKRADLDTSSPSTRTLQVLVPGDEASRSDVWKQSTHVDQRPYVIQHSVQGNSFQYDHGQRHSRKNTVDSSELLSEEIVALAHELSQVQDKLSRLNDAVLQQVAGQMKAAERLESLLVAHGQAAAKNSKHTRRLFKRLKRSCCQCQGKAGPPEGVAASKRRGGQKRKQGRFDGEKEKINPLGHTATGTVNSTGDCMHMGVKSDVSSLTNKTSAFTTTTRTVPIVTTRTTTTAPTVATKITPAAKTRSTPRFNRSTRRPLSTKTTTPVTQKRTTRPAAFTKHRSAATTTIAATTTTSKPQKQVADAHEDGEPDDDDGGDDDDNDDDDNSSSEEESEEDSKEKESEEGEGTSEDSDVNGDDEADDEEKDGTSEDEKDTEEMTNQTSEREDKKNEKDKKERIDLYDLLGNNDTVEDRHHENRSKDLTEEHNGTRSTEHTNESNSDTSYNMVLQYPQLAPYNTEEKDDGILKPTSDPSPHSMDYKTDRNANQSQKATDITTTNREIVESLHIVEDASNTKGTSEKTSSGGEQEILGATSRGSELHGTGEVDAHAPTTDGRYVLIDSQEHVTDAPDLVTDTTGTRAHATSAEGHGIDTEYHTTAAGDHSAVGRGHTTDVQKRTISPSEDTVYSQDHITTSRGLQIEYQEQNRENSGDLMHIRHVTNKEYTETDPANDFSTLQNLIEDTHRNGSDDGRDTFSSAPANDDDFTTRQNIPAIDTEISGSRTKDEVPVSNEEGRPSKMPQAHDDNFQIPTFQTSSDNLNLQEATAEITTTSINLDKLVGETQNLTTDTNVGTGTPAQKVGKEGTRHNKDVSTTTASNMYYPFKDAPFVNGEDHVNMEGSDEKKHEDEMSHQNLKTSLHLTEHFDTTTVPAESASTPSLKPIVHAATSSIVDSTAGRMHTESMAPSSTTMNIGSELIMTTTSSTTLTTHLQEDTPFFASTSSSSAASTAITTSGATAAPATMTTQPETTTAPTTATTTQLLTTTTATPSTTSTSTTTTPWTTTSKTTTTPATTNTPTTTSTTPSRRTTATTRSRNTTTVPTKKSPPVLTTPETEVYLEVDLTTGDVDGEDLPGMTWVVRPTAPGSARVTSRRTRRSTTLEDRLCEMQGVLKFTFTPPPPTRRPPDRYGRRSADDDVGGGSGGGGREHLLLDMWFRNPRRWVFNLGDSIANNGFSGDGSVQENDCEVQGYGSTFAVYGSDKHTNVREKLLHSDGTFTFNKLTLVVSDQTILWNNHRGKADTVRHFSLFALAGQSDSQGEVNYDVYLGLNRVIDGSYRSGSGLCRVQARWLDGESPST